MKFLNIHTLSFILIFGSWDILSVNSENILVLSFFSSKSHKITYMSLIEGLAAKGHNVTIVSPVKPFKITENITEVYTVDMMPIFNQFDTFKLKEANKKFNFLTIFSSIHELCNISLNLPQVKQVFSQQFDLVFMQPTLSECSLGNVFKIGAPLVIWSPTSAPDFIASKLGSHLPSSFVPNVMLEYSQTMNFWERFLNFGINIMFDMGSLLLYESGIEKMYRDHLNDQSIPSIREILGNASLLLSNGHFSISGPRPYLPDIIDVGGIHSHPPKKLPQDLEKFVSKPGSKGFIYFSLGSVINTDDMSEEKRKLLLNVFAKLKDYQIVWKWNNENMTDKSENVLLSKWLPQQDLLGHDKIKLFITHCGLGGTEEAIFHGIQMLAIPFLGDQPLNAAQAKRMGIAEILDWNELTEETLLSRIHEVMENPKYRNNIKKLSAIFKDQPENPLTRGIYWLEYVIRHKGAPHLRSASRKLNYFQYHSWDIILAYLTVICLAFYILVKIVKFVGRKIYSLIFGPAKNNSINPKKTN